MHELDNLDDDFQTVTYKRKSSLIGTGKSSNSIAVKKRPWSLFISRATTDNTNEDIAFHVRDLLPNANIECLPLQT